MNTLEALNTLSNEAHALTKRARTCGSVTLKQDLELKAGAIMESLELIASDLDFKFCSNCKTFIHASEYEFEACARCEGRGQSYKESDDHAFRTRSL